MHVLERQRCIRPHVTRVKYASTQTKSISALFQAAAAETIAAHIMELRFENG